MAKANVRVRKKVKKNIAEGIAHVHASFNNTILRSQIAKVMRFHGQHLVVLVSKVLVRVSRLLLKLQQKQLVKLLKNVVLRTLRFVSKDLVQAANQQFVH